MRLLVMNGLRHGKRRLLGYNVRHGDQADNENSPAMIRTIGRSDGTAHGLDETSAYRQSQPGSRRLAVTRLQTAELIENMLQTI